MFTYPDAVRQSPGTLIPLLANRGQQYECSLISRTPDGILVEKIAECQSGILRRSRPVKPVLGILFWICHRGRYREGPVYLRELTPSQIFQLHICQGQLCSFRKPAFQYLEILCCLWVVSAQS